ncbi:GNAT family N-acetyltransferase [Plantactinospora sp. CA-294935]|uniref:GNAT family N-acetyltransferase n=1 Tax=Plantactinospora sp. CA-294935 TaxID=3240012 RepID=UPI003D8C73EB
MTSAATTTLERVVDRRGLRDFLAVSDRVYADEPRFVPPTRAQVRRWWREGVPMYLLRDADTGAAVGRTTLHTDAGLDAKLGRRCQLFGLTEFTEPAAEPLFEAITAAGRAAGDREVLFGPVALLPNEAGGVITSGYADRGFVDSAYNPPRYVTGYESYGFARRFESDTWICPVTPAPAGSDPLLEDPQLRVHRGDLRRLDEQLDLLRELLNASFAQLGYYTEISAEQLRRQTDGLAYLLDESLLLYLTRAERPVAFVLCIPDISEFVIRVRGNLNLVNQLRLLATRRRYRREAVLIVKGVLPEYQGRGYQRMLSAQLHRNLHAGGYTTLRSTYVGRDNPASAAQFRAMGGRPLHGYTFYEKAL